MARAVLERILSPRLWLLWNGFQVRRRVPRFVDVANAGPPRPNRLFNRVVAGLRFVTRMHRENLRLVRTLRRRLAGLDRSEPVTVVGHGDALDLVRAETRRRGLPVTTTLTWRDVDGADDLVPADEPVVLAVLANHEAWLARLEATGIGRERVVVACPLAGVDD